MSKVAHYLQEHLVGEVMTGTDARRYFATDGSILQLPPALIVYPRNENDIRKTARFSWQLAERGRIIPVTARGSGTNTTGAALGSGIVIVFPAHLNRILELDTKANTVTVEPGINFSKLQQTLHTHGRFLPAYPPTLEYSTLGGAIANNVAGERSIKYGDIRNFIQGMRVVLANGEVVETGRLGKRELSKKLGLATFEGEIYRSLDTLLEEHKDLIGRLDRNGLFNNAGYGLADVLQRDGSFDLTPLIAGSQGTLGIISEVMLGTEPYNPQSTVMLAQFDSLEKLQEAVVELRKLGDGPAVMELVDQFVLQQIHALNPNQLKDIMAPPFPLFTLLVEFEDDKHAKKALKQADKVFEKHAVAVQSSTKPEEQQKYWKLRQATGTLVAHNDGPKRALPLIDGGVPADRLREYLEGLYALCAAIGVKPAIWGHAGDGELQLQPHLNLGQVGDRQKAFRLLDEQAKLVIKLGGTISSTAGEGRLRAPYVEAMYGSELYALLQKVKKIFDPYGTLNPGVKFGTSQDDIKSMLNANYSLDRAYDHLPRS
jgi:FAD/FMN-containing dehydrogenase